VGAPIRVLVVDDSAVVRRLLSRGLSEDPEIEVVGTAADPFEARDRILALRPDVLTLDVEMPRMDGLTFLRKLMPQHPMPVVMVSSLTTRGAQVTLEALAAGAVDVVAKPRPGSPGGMEGMIAELRAKVRAASRARVAAPRRLASRATPPPGADPLPAAARRAVVALGASTGGTEAIQRVVSRLPSDGPPVLIVQHLPAGFSAPFASQLDRESPLSVSEARTGAIPQPGHAYVAPGGRQLRLLGRPGQFRLDCSSTEKVSGHCPSVDVLMTSVAGAAGARAIGVILTGMGADGARGLLRMRQAGAATLGQDEATCVVYGMPRAAAELGAVQVALPLDAMADRIRILLRKLGDTT